MNAINCFCPRLIGLAARRDLGVEPFGEAGDELRDVVLGQELHQLLARVTGVLAVAYEDVVPDGAGEEEGLLKDEANPGRPFLRRVRADVAPVEQDAAARRVVEPRHQRGGRGLAAAGRSDERVGLTALERERDVVKDFLAPWIAEADVLELETGVPRSRRCAGHHRQVGLERQDGRDPIESGQRELK